MEIILGFFVVMNSGFGLLATSMGAVGVDIVFDYWRVYTVRIFETGLRVAGYGDSEVESWIEGEMLKAGAMREPL